MMTIDKKIFINAAPEVVWRHPEDPDLLAGWLMRNNFQARPGTEFQFWQTPSGEWDGAIDSRLVEFEPPRRMTFTWNANTIGTDTLVSIELKGQGEGTLLRLLHTNCRAAWVYFLTVLKTLLEHGVDGRDKSRATGASFSTYFDPSAIGLEV